MPAFKASVQRFKEGSNIMREIKTMKKRKRIKYLNNRFQTNRAVFFAVSIVTKCYAHEKTKNGKMQAATTSLKKH